MNKVNDISILRLYNGLIYRRVWAAAQVADMLPVNPHCIFSRKVSYSITLFSMRKNSICFNKRAASSFNSKDSCFKSFAESAS